MRQITFAIDGMSCDGCVRTVARAIRALPGTRVDAVHVGTATVTYDPSRTSSAAIIQAVQAAGYRPAGATAPPRAAGASRCCGGSSRSCCR